MEPVRAATRQKWWPNEMLYNVHWPIYRKRCACACSFRSSAISQPARLPTCSICKRWLFASVLCAHANNFNSCMHLKAGSRLVTVKLLLLLQVCGTLTSVKTQRSVLRTGQLMMNCTARSTTHIPRFCGGIMRKDSLEGLL